MKYSKEYLKELIEMFQLYLNNDTRMLAYNLGLKIIKKYYTHVVSRNLIEGDTKIFFNITWKSFIWYEDQYNHDFENFTELSHYEVRILNKIIITLENMLENIDNE